MHFTRQLSGKRELLWHLLCYLVPSELLPTTSPTVFIAQVCTLNTQRRACAVNVRKHERSSRMVELIKGCFSCSSALYLFITLTLALLLLPFLTLLYSSHQVTVNCPTSYQS